MAKAKNETKMMGKRDLCKAVQDELARDREIFVTLKDVNEIIEVALSEIKKAVLDGYKVRVNDFGSWLTVTQRSRNHYDPRSGKVAKLPDKRRIKFNVSGTWKEGLNR